MVTYQVDQSGEPAKGTGSQSSSTQQVRGQVCKWVGPGESPLLPTARAGVLALIIRHVACHFAFSNFIWRGGQTRKSKRESSLDAEDHFMGLHPSRLNNLREERKDLRARGRSFCRNTGWRWSVPVLTCCVLFCLFLTFQINAAMSLREGHRLHLKAQTLGRENKGLGHS